MISSLLSVVSAVHPELAQIIDRCLRRDPAARYASAEALGHALEEINAAPAAAVLADGNPYRGLYPFESEHRGLFFGRAAPLSRRVIDVANLAVSLCAQALRRALA